MDYELFVNAKDLPESLRKYFPNKDIVSIQDIIEEYYNLDNEFKEFREDVNEFYVYKPDKYPEPREYGE